jgi:hypothetical protein
LHENLMKIRVKVMARSKNVNFQFAAGGSNSAATLAIASWGA